ncbi:GyrI-like domain-containing protein [Flavobacterium sp. WC2509]|uniref:GyrI-like domain-containing protein n=1 Tax=Flavobacterium sp. WC2509 TaxID=3461406 RepID=UPI004044C5C4
MNPRIINLREKKLIGKRLTMSFTNYKVSELWKDFMPRRKQVDNNLSNDLISMTVYEPTHFLNFSPTNEFEKWATVEVSDFDNVPSKMETFTLAGGLYVVFDYKGLNTDDSIYRYIYGEWIPNSDYDLDNRPHFEILGDKYKNGDPTSEEEIWIPIKQKQ